MEIKQMGQMVKERIKLIDLFIKIKIMQDKF